MTNRKPQVGDSIWYFPPAEDQVARSNGNKGVVAATITRVWGHDATSAVNLKVLPDHGPVQDRGSVASMYTLKGTRTWCFKGDFPLDVDGIPIFTEEVLKAPEFPQDTIRATGL